MHTATRMLSVIPTHTGQPSEVPDEFGAPLDVVPDPAQMAALRPQVIDALRTVFDPEIPVDIVALGLVYSVDIDQAAGEVRVRMPLTAPGCGMGPVLVGDVESRGAKVPHVRKVTVELVFDPPWSREMMSDEARLETGMFY